VSAAAPSVAGQQDIEVQGPTASLIRYVVPQGYAYRLEATSFTVDLTGAAGAADVFVEWFNAEFGYIAGEAPGSAQAQNTRVQYALAPYLNPCDGITSVAYNLTPDTFPALVIDSGCIMLITATDPTTGNLVTGARISDVWLRVTQLGTVGEAELGPLLTPLAAGSGG
jgi:hypothetical protein